MMKRPRLGAAGILDSTAIANGRGGGELLHGADVVVVLVASL
jgi:hypothetical protein